MMINSLFLIIISILPVLLIGLFIYKKDKEKEPFNLLLKLFLLGVLSCLPAAIIENIIAFFFGDIENLTLPLLFIYVSLGIAFVEELVKWIIVYKCGYNSKEFDHVYDALVYCAFVSLGFACFENIFYVFSEATIKIGLLRAVTAIPGHVCNAIVMGDYLGSAKTYQLCGDFKKEKRCLLFSLLLPTFTHTVYDYCIYSNNGLLIIFFMLFLVSIYIFSFIRIKKLSSIKDNLNNHRFTEINFCSNCGTKAIGVFCTSCGKKIK